MNKLILLIASLVITSVSGAQNVSDFKKTELNDFYFDEEENPIPVCLTKKYRDVINLDEIKPAYVFAPINNDSMYQVEYDAAYFEEMHRKSVPVVSSYKVQFDVSIDYKEKAAKIDVDEGTLWIFRITSTTAYSLGAIFENVIIPPGSRMTFFNKTYNDVYGNWPDVSLATGEASSFAWSLCTYSINEYETERINDFYIEYFEPANAPFSPELTIKKLIYGYGNQANSGTGSQKMQLKGGHGTSNWQCNNDIACSVGKSWENCAKAVCFIKISNDVLIPQTAYLGSGVFLNKSGDGYLADENPFILSAAHLFGNASFGIPIKLLHDDKYTRIEIIVNYQYGACGSQNQSTLGSRATTLHISDIKAIGNNFWLKPDDAFYDPKNDFVLLQSDKSIKKLVKLDIEYAAWDRFTSIQEGAAIGHPNGDAKKVVINRQNPLVCGDGSFKMDWDVGVSEEGLSGAPVFTISGWHHVQGIVITEDEDPNKSCGNSTSNCLDFSYIYPNVAPYINPTNKFSALNKNYSNEITYLPTHCSNCVRDGNEAGLDCGDDCLPCGIEDNIIIASAMEFFSRDEMKARFETTINTSSLAQMKSGNKTILSGEAISMKGVEFQKGVTVNLDINAELVDIPNTRGCFVPCIAMANTFTPNGDGVNDFLRVSQSFVRKWSIQIRDKYGKLIHTSDTYNVNYDGIINIWSGLGTKSGWTYAVNFIYSDCNNKWYNKGQMVTVFK